ncbi:hypothetical protein Bbelb_011340 [Branchiostoma belcheri]|nr:hypothetical protein Bbelb_011340 [Branchiostoma belcheri]
MATFRTNFFDKRPSAETEAKLRARIAQRSAASSGGCLTWTGARSRRGYGRMRVRGTGGDEQEVSPHRVAFFLCSDRPNLDTNMHVSHLCNNKVCVNPGHLSYEEGVVNQQRKNCFSEGRCSGNHPGYPNCIITQ